MAAIIIEDMRRILINVGHLQHNLKGESFKVRQRKSPPIVLIMVERMQEAQDRFSTSISPDGGMEKIPVCLDNFDQANFKYATRFSLQDVMINNKDFTIDE